MSTTLPEFVIHCNIKRRLIPNTTHHTIVKCDISYYITKYILYNNIIIILVCNITQLCKMCDDIEIDKCE